MVPGGVPVLSSTGSSSASGLSIWSITWIWFSRPLSSMRSSSAVMTKVARLAFIRSSREGLSAIDYLPLMAVATSTADCPSK